MKYIKDQAAASAQNAEAVAARASETGASILKPGWEAMKDPSSGKTYYHHAASGETAWDMPLAPAKTSAEANELVQQTMGAKAVAEGRGASASRAATEVRQKVQSSHVQSSQVQSSDSRAATEVRQKSTK